MIRLPSPVAASIVFIEAGAVLVLEILSVRLLAPYVGLTLETTTSIIGAVLLGISLGAYIGGYIADRVSPPRLVVTLFIGGGGLSLFTVPIVRYLGPGAIGHGTSGALIVTFSALVPVAAVLSAISPAIAHWQLQDLKSSGTVVGGLSAWATAGALVGTFGTGYVLIPLLSASSTVLIVGGVLIVSGAVLSVFTRLFGTRTVLGIIIVGGILGATSTLVKSPCMAETDYHCVNIVTAKSNSGRYLVLDTEANSFVDLGNPYNLGTFRYAHWVAEGIDEHSKGAAPLNAVFIGGGGFTLPKWLRATRPGSTSTVLEVDSQLVTFDKRHLALRTGKRIKVITGDARLTMLKQRSQSADVVVGDSFSGLTVPWQLMTTEWLMQVRRVLRPYGLYAINMIDYKPLSLLRAELASLLTIFHYVDIVTKSAGDGLPGGGNVVIFASNGPVPEITHPYRAKTYDYRYITTLARGATILTDNYSPVDQLQTR
jgi:spermidine synthase